MYDDDDNDQFNNDSSDVVGTLRAANKAQAKQLKELIASLETATNSVTELTGKVNATTVAKLLAAKGVDPGVSSFMIGVEPNEESINTWLATNGKLIGYDPTKGSDEGSTDEVQPVAQEKTQVSPEMAALQAAMAAVQNQEANAAPGLAAGQKGVEAVSRLGDNAKSFEDVEKGLKDLGIIK